MFMACGHRDGKGEALGAGPPSEAAPSPKGPAWSHSASKSDKLSHPTPGNLPKGHLQETNLMETISQIPPTGPVGTRKAEREGASVWHFFRVVSGVGGVTRARRVCK